MRSLLSPTLSCLFLLAGFHANETLPAVTRLTSDVGAELWASWSPDGSRVLFAGNHAGSPAIYVMSPAGENRRLLAGPPVMDRHPRWLDDGTVVFDSRRTGNDDIFEITADGSGLRQLTFHAAADGAGLPSPDGRHIAFLSQRGGGSWELFVMDRSGERQRRIATDAVMHAWIPGGSRLVFAGPTSGDLFEADVMTGEVVPLVSSPDTERFPRPSPDGRWLLFTRVSGTTATLWLKDLRSEDLRQLRTASGRVEWLTWCGDSQHAVFASGASGEEDLFAVRINDDRLDRLTGTAGREVSPSCDVKGRVIFSAGIGDELDLYSLTLPGR